MSISDDRNIHYIGTDPNTDHTVIREDSAPKAQSMMNSLGFSMRKLTEEQSICIQTHTKYTNAVQKISHVRMKPFDLVFTSPPYFAKEAYSDDEEQSYKKFNQYETWVEGFS